MKPYEFTDFPSSLGSKKFQCPPAFQSLNHWAMRTCQHQSRPNALRIRGHDDMKPPSSNIFKYLWYPPGISPTLSFFWNLGISLLACQRDALSESKLPVQVTKDPHQDRLWPSNFWLIPECIEVNSLSLDVQELIDTRDLLIFQLLALTAMCAPGFFNVMKDCKKNK